ncbi:glycosyltransferase family 2 protein, partial [Leptodesmis sp.]|uniref:glycosyltransferase family 2 protein n=1 Tax=Leptodesmis sp. TaxID=3100501 RepID=UPI004053544C
RANSTACDGSSVVVRLDELAEGGGFVTRSVSEDMYTGIRISALGYQIVYLDENLSAGLVPEDVPSQILQRQRWGRGSMQAFFLKENPLTIPGLTWRQRIAYMEGIFQWFNSPIRIVFLFLPIAVTFFDIVPFFGTLHEWIYYFLPFYLVQLSTLSWLNHRANAAFALEVYSVATCFPIAATVLQTLFRPFGKGFQVTPKGSSSTKVVFRWKLAAPLIGLSILTFFSLLWEGYHLLDPGDNFIKPATLEYFKLGLIWNGYNLIVLGLAILSLFDVPKPSIYSPLHRCYSIHLQVGDRCIEGTTNWISEIDAEVNLPREEAIDRLLPGDSVVLHISQDGLSLNTSIVTIQPCSNSITLQLKFEHLSSEQHRDLVELLFCTPGQWHRQMAPGELQMLGLLLRSLLQPRVLFSQSGKPGDCLNPVPMRSPG